MYSNLIYVSVRSPLCTGKEIKKILAASEKNNIKLDISGVLLYTSNRFVQFLEGDYENILKLYNKIKNDDRHINVILVSLKRNVSENRIFPSWAMAGKSVDDSKLQFKTKLSTEEQGVFSDLLHGKESEQAIAVNAIMKLFK